MQIFDSVNLSTDARSKQLMAVGFGHGFDANSTVVARKQPDFLHHVAAPYREGGETRAIGDGGFNDFDLRSGDVDVREFDDFGFHVYELSG